MDVFLIENGSNPLNYTQAGIETQSEGMFSISQAVKHDLGIRSEFKIFDQNG